MIDIGNRTIILASASPRRAELLHQIGLPHQVIPSCIEEKITAVEPDLVVMQLSVQKAADIAAQYGGPNTIVIGADTVVAADGEILGKPKDRAEAAVMISRLQGQTHQVYSGVTIIFGESEKIKTFAEKTEVQVYPMSDWQIDQYINTDEPLDKAGAYGIQGFFAAFIKGIRGDYNNVVGLPLGRLVHELGIGLKKD